MYEKQHVASSAGAKARYYTYRAGQSVLGVPSRNPYV